MRAQGLPGRLAAGLEQAGLPYMFTGSFVSSLQGYPREIGNLDVVVALPAAALPALARAFPPPDFELDLEAARLALARAEAFALVEADSGAQVDFWPLGGSAFDRSRFARRREESFQGALLAVCAPEDTILSKLPWGQRWGQLARQLEDARGVYELQYSRLELDYLRRWAAELGLEGPLRELERTAHPAG